MTFEQKVKANPEIQNCFHSGKQALGSNAQKVNQSNPRELEGSVFLDECLHPNYPNSPLWDYMVGYKRAVYFIEVHPATTKDINQMLSKLEWLQNWLNQNGPEFRQDKAQDRPFRWVASGKVGIAKNSQQARKLIKSSLSWPKEKITLD